jgi:hypothetical protein
MSYWDTQKARMKAYSSVRDERISDGKRLIEHSFFDSPSYYRVDVYSSSTPLSSTPLDAWVVDDSKIRDQKKIVAYPDQNLDKGYLVFWKNDYWLTTQSDEELGDIYNRGTLLRCVSTLKWLDENKKIQETPFCFRIDTPSNFGVDDSKKYIVMPDERRHITIQDNEHTRKIKKDKNFIVDGRRWTVITVDRLIRGIINIVLAESEANLAVDNMELKIADYNNNLDNYSISIVNPIDKLEIDTDYQMIIEVYNNNEKVGVQSTYISSDENILTVDEEGTIVAIAEGTAMITVSYADVSETIAIEVVGISVENKYVVFDTVSYIYTNQTKTFNAHYENNGIPYTDSSLFSIKADNEVSNTNLATIVSQNGVGNNCSIKASGTMGWFKLLVKNSDEQVTGVQRIEIRSVL